jgi:hypothetical protein
MSCGRQCALDELNELNELDGIEGGIHCRLLYGFRDTPLPIARKETPA